MAPAMAHSGRGAATDDLPPAVADEAHHQDAGEEACAEGPRTGAVRLGLNALLQIVDPGAGPVTRLLGARTRGLCCSVLRGTQVVLDLVRIPARPLIAILRVHAEFSNVSV